MTIFEAVCLFLLFYIHLYAFYSIDRIIVWNRQLLTYAKNGNIQKKTVYIQVYTLYQGISFYDKDPELESHNSYYRKNNDYTRLDLRRKKRPDNLTKITIKTGATQPLSAHKKGPSNGCLERLGGSRRRSCNCLAEAPCLHRARVSRSWNSCYDFPRL